MTRSSLGGYKVVPIQFSSESSSQHALFLKEHSVRLQTVDKPLGKTLFVSNVPPYATEESLQRLFKTAGNIKSVKFENDGSGFKSAYIVFNKAESLYKALNLKILPPLSTDGHPVLTGIGKWAAEYNKSVEDETALKERIAAVMHEYDKTEAAKKANDKEVDDEGWTVVGKKGRNPGLSRKESLKDKLNEKSISKPKELKNFYTFQLREAQRNKLADLRKKFDEDKKKINSLKQARKFKPYAL